jgi:hypothetical protein
MRNAFPGHRQIEHLARPVAMSFKREDDLGDVK